MKNFIPFIFCFCLAQESYTGEITFDYNGNVSGSFTSIIQDSIPIGFAFNQEGADTSYFIMGAFTEQENNEFDLFLAVLQIQHSPFNLGHGTFPAKEICKIH